MAGEDGSISGPTEHLSDEELACRAQAGCSAALASLAERYNDVLLRHLRRRTPCLQDAEDLVQETLLKVSRNLHRYDPSRSFSTWLLTVATRLAISRGRARPGPVAIEDVDGVADSADPQQRAARNETSENLWLLAERELSDKQYQALWLRYSGEMSVKEIAGRMKLTRVHVKVLLHRARKRLLRFAEQLGMSGGPGA